MSKEEKQIQEEFSQDWIIYKLTTHETKPCTLWELENKYTISQAYKMLEIVDVFDARKKIAIDRARAEQNK